MIGLKRGTVKLVTHQDEWLEEAEKTIEELKRLLNGAAADLQHVGSTAIPSIHAKPIIDLVIGVYDLNEIMSHVEPVSYTHLRAGIRCRLSPDIRLKYLRSP